MKQIPFTQFLMPNGEQRTISIPLEDDCFEKYKEISACGCRLTAEMLRTGECSFCIEHPDGDFDCRICPNGPQVPILVTEMIRDFTKEKFDNWLMKLNS
jgi:hypothetical protein